MKKYLCMLAVVGMAASAFAQGQVTFANGSTTLVKDTGGVAIAVAGGFAQLFWAPAGAAYTAWTPNQTASDWLSKNPAWKANSVIKAFGPVAGRINLGTLDIPATAAGGIAAGGNIDAVLVAWKGAAATFDAAIAAKADAGFSAKMANFTTGNPTTVPPGTPTALGAVFQGLTLSANPGTIPEPSALALAGLGAAALMIFRRRN